MTPDEEVQVIFDRARYYEELYYASKSNVGQVIMTELKSQINDLRNSRNLLGSKDLAPPYKMETADIEKMELYSVKISALLDLEVTFDLPKLKELFQQYQEEAQLLKDGSSLEPTYV